MSNVNNIHKYEEVGDLIKRYQEIPEIKEQIVDDLVGMEEIINQMSKEEHCLWHNYAEAARSIIAKHEKAQ